MVRFLVPLLLLAQAQTPTPAEIRKQLEPIQAALERVIEQLPKQTIVTTSAELTAALANGGLVELQADTTFAGAFTISKSGTRIVGHNSTIAAGPQPALRIPPGVVDVDVSDLTATSTFSGGVIECGQNGPGQTTVAQQPARITFRNITVPSHRGKRAFELNCSATILASTVTDVWASSIQDSQAILVSNTCGPVTVIGGTYSAGSENIMVGGDTLKITDCPEGVAADLLFDSVTLIKPDEWRTDGVNRGVKNLFELKAGKRVTLRNSRLSGSWKAAQDGWAIVVTPKNGQYIATVLLEGLEVDRAAGGLNLLGKDYNSVTPIATTGLTVRNSTFNVSKAMKEPGRTDGRGILALVNDGFLEARFENVQARLDGCCIFQADTKAGMPQGPFVMVSSTMPTGGYAVMANGVNYGGPTPPAYAGKEFLTSFDGNTFLNAPRQFRGFYPSNTWVAELPPLSSPAVVSNNTRIQ